jgi:hypothetical protein
MITDIKPIRDDRDHAAALAEIERLWTHPIRSSRAVEQRGATRKDLNAGDAPRQG